MGACGSAAGRPTPGSIDRLKEWWREQISTYNILRKPLEMRARDRTAGGRRQRRETAREGLKRS